MTGFTIGEVLNRLKDEFDDITISKIRFLEAEGLIHPDRTDSGYRKFDDPDVERLRYVLRAQRDRYLPLKVIKEELERLDQGQAIAPPLPPVPSLPDGAAPAPPGAPPAADSGQAGGVLSTGPTDVSLSLTELTDATGLRPQDVQQLREHGLLRGDVPFDGDDLLIARAAVPLLRLGLEARHLRMFRQFADRELSLYEQRIAPLLRQRNPDSRRTAVQQLEDLEQHGRRLQRALLARELRTLLRS